MLDIGEFLRHSPCVPKVDSLAIFNCVCFQICECEDCTKSPSILPNLEMNTMNESKDFCVRNSKT